MLTETHVSVGTTTFSRSTGKSTPLLHTVVFEGEELTLSLIHI